MQRISTLLQKINELASKGTETDLIEVDLMMDYTRVLYADLAEWRSRLAFNDSVAAPAPDTVPDRKTGEDIVPTNMQPPQQVPTNVQPQPQPNIRKWIGINDKYLFISELFGNDKEAYELMLTQMNLSGNYDDAVAWLAEIHGERNWNDEDVTIQSFYGLLSQFFSER